MGEYDDCYDDEFDAGTKYSTADAQEEKKDIPKPIFYRISSLPLSMNEDNMWDILETLPAPASSPHDQNNARVDNLSVCHSADMQTKTAVVVFWNHTPRKFLACRPKEPIKVKLGGYLKENNIGPYPELENREVEIDVDFLGITPVFEHEKEPKFEYANPRLASAWAMSTVFIQSANYLSAVL